MPLSPEEVERRLRALEERDKELERLARHRPNPFEDITTQLALEGGGTVSARTRRVPMTTLIFPTYVTNATLNWPDGSTTELRSSVPIPGDWVEGTDLTLNLMVYKTGANSENAVFNTWISSNSTGGTRSWNIESAGINNYSIPASSELRYLTKTVTGTDVSSGEVIHWISRRVGGDGGDTLGEALHIEGGPWMEYTAFF